MSLPPPRPNQLYCNVSALEAGLLQLQLQSFITGATPGEAILAPSLSFLIQHSYSHTKVIFDLGVRRDIENYPPKVAERAAARFQAYVPQDVSESLSKGNLSPSDIDIVCLSHCHWDHIGDTKLFNNATFLVGGESRSLFSPGYPEDPDSLFASDILPINRTRFLSLEDPNISWIPIGPFSHAFDYFGDGSLYIINAPGHLPGHINALVRTSADGAWIYLAGDSAHHWALITGEADVSGGHEHGSECAHRDKARAEDTIEKIRSLWKLERVRVLLAHDAPWFKENKGGEAFWPGKIPSL